MSEDRWKMPQQVKAAIGESTLPRCLSDMTDLGLVRLAFALGSKVKIRECDLTAFVVTASVSIRGVLYQCAYWNDKSRTETWFEEFELEAME